MKILLIAAEAAPFVKVGGLGDVMGSLPQALTELGHSVRVIIPHHGVINDRVFGIKPASVFQFPWNGNNIRVEVSHAVAAGVDYYFVRGWPYFSKNERFVYSLDAGIDIGRFLFFASSIVELLARWSAKDKWTPEIIHANDWHSAGIPFLIRRVHSGDDLLGRIPVVFSIHNMQYQGWGVGWHLALAGMPPVDHALLNASGKNDSMMAIALAYSTVLSTVSPRYAQEIATPEGGYGLEEIVHARTAHLYGILNGIDTRRWNPEESTVLAAQYSANTIEHRLENKRALQHELGLIPDQSTPLIGVVTRLVEQKGPTIMIPAARRILASREVNFILLGTGQTDYERQAFEIGEQFPYSARIRLEFDEDFSERIYAGSDIFFMPSLFEPCGIGQMIAMRYGSIPVVREVGGLADTVSPDIGFLFSAFDADAATSALETAVDQMANPVEWANRQGKAMRRDFSWVQSAKQYVELYQHALELHLQYA